MKYFCLSFDLEEFDIPIEFGIKIKEEDTLRESFEGTKKIMNLLDELKVGATFFVTAKFAEKFPSVIQRLSEKHEIALHGYKHDSNYKTMAYDAAFAELSKAKRIIERIISKRIYGFRSPRSICPDLKVLKDLGISYDASLHPTYIPGHYNNFFKKRKPYIQENIVRIPTSVTPLIRSPFTWLWFRNLGLTYAKLCTKAATFTEDYVSIYFHPWEFQNLKSYALPNYIQRNTGQNLERNLKEYILWCLKNKFRFTTIEEYVRSKGHLNH